MLEAATGAPVLIRDDGQEVLERVRLGSGTYSEAWLQALIHEHPTCLPVAQIEPGFSLPVPAAREVASGHGFIDNVYLTPAGEIIIVETKLWANPQARREVVAQALDYAAALSAMSYEQFEAAVLKARKEAACGSLHAIVAGVADALDEPQFIDAVAANLARGRMLVLVAADGIRRETEALAGLLQSHAGAHFTFALVELAAYRTLGEGRILIVPSTLMKTTLIERGVVRIDDQRTVVRPMVEPLSPGGSAPKAQSLTEQTFYEAIAARASALPQHIRAFIDNVAPLNVYADMKGSLNLKLENALTEKPINLGYIGKDGRLRTDAVGWFAPERAARNYVETLAALVGGEVVTGNAWSSASVKVDGKPPLIDQLLPAHAEEWRNAIQRLIDDLRRES